MSDLTSKELDRIVRGARKITGLPITLKDIEGDYGLVLFDPEQSPPLYHPLASFTTRGEPLVWLQGFVAGWRTKGELS